MDGISFAGIVGVGVGDAAPSGDGRAAGVYSEVVHKHNACRGGCPGKEPQNILGEPSLLVCMGADPRPKVKSERPGLVSADTIASGFGVPIVVSLQTGSKLVAGLAQCSPATVRGSKSRATPFDVNVTVCGIPPGAGSLQCTVILNGGGSGYVFWWCVSDMPPP